MMPMETTAEAAVATTEAAVATTEAKAKAKATPTKATATKATAEEKMRFRLSLGPEDAAKVEWPPVAGETVAIASAVTIASHGLRLTLGPEDAAVLEWPPIAGETVPTTVKARRREARHPYRRDER
jgi:hypothetical protein